MVTDHAHVMTIRIVIVVSQDRDVKYSCILTIPFDDLSDEDIYLQHLVLIKNAVLTRLGPDLISVINDPANKNALVETYVSLGCSSDECLQVLKVSFSYPPILFSIRSLYHIDTFRESLSEIIKEAEGVTEKIRAELDDLYTATTDPAIFFAYLIADGVLYGIMLDYYKDQQKILANSQDVTKDDFTRYMPNRGLPC